MIENMIPILIFLLSAAFHAESNTYWQEPKEELSDSKKQPGLPMEYYTVTVSSNILSRWNKISLRDNGNVIREEIRDKIFQSFFTFSSTGHETGLGLSPAYDIIKVHGRERRLETERGKGSIVII